MPESHDSEHTSSFYRAKYREDWVESALSQSHVLKLFF